MAFLCYVSRGVFALVIIFVRFFRLSFLASKHHLTGAETVASTSPLLEFGLGSIGALKDTAGLLASRWWIYGFFFISCTFLAAARSGFVPVSRVRLYTGVAPQVTTIFCLIVLYHAGLCVFLSILP